MKKLIENGKINFIVNVHYDYGECLTGGIVAMHYLAYLLAKEGHNVYIFCKPEYPHENIHYLKSWRSKRLKGEGINSEEAEIRTWENFSYDNNNTVSIYDQDIKWNWFGTHHVARWLVYTADKNMINTWGKDDSIFSYGQQKEMLKGIDKKTINLIAMDMHLDKFNNKNEKRKGFCYLFHKHTSPNAELFLKELNATNLSNWKKEETFYQNYLNEEFNKHEYFICYDQLSFWPQIAAICGCKVIIMNVKDNPNAYYDYNTTPEEYRLQNPLKKYGVAFGFNDLPHAVNTQHLVKAHLNEMNELNLETVKNFITFWENKCYG